MLISHRGKGSGKGENNLAAFDEVFRLGADGVECDLNITADNKIVVAHDKPDKYSANNLSIDELFNYIKQKNKPFFLEVKSSSPVLLEKIIEKIKDNNLWNLVHIIGFSTSIGTALRAQNKYPKLKVMPLINFPPFAYIKKPKKSYGVFVGWINEWPGTEFLFRIVLPPKRLDNLRKFYEKNGFKVMAGVANTKSSFEYFKKANIEGITTDNVPDAVKYFK